MHNDVTADGSPALVVKRVLAHHAPRRARYCDCKADSVGGYLMGKATGSCKGKGGSMHIADVDQGMLGANGIGTRAIAVGQIAAVSAGYGPVMIAGQGQMSIA